MIADELVGLEPSSLPTLLQLAETKLRYAGPRDRTINIKITVNTARMMVDSERTSHDKLLAAAKFAHRIFDGHSGRPGDAITDIEFGQREVALEQLRDAILKAGV